MSYEGTIVVDGVDYGHRLPRGRHGIPHETVIANQRERLLDAATAVFGEQGYASLSVANVIERAGVSRGTFYKLFENKSDCLLAAQQRAFGRLHEAIEAACSPAEEWPLGVSAAVNAVLDFAAASPDETRLILASSHPAAEPELARDGISLNRWLIDLLRDSSKRHPDARSPNDLTEQASVGAAVSIVGTILSDQRIGRMPDLTATLVQIILAPYLGGDEALRIARAAG
ncbi:MAG TPA: TetR/AcrR family transcriptional regulator [Solirubrobacterales bacterium]